MKKIYFLLSGLLFAGSALKAQHILLSEDFNSQTFYDNLIDGNTPPPANTTDPSWYSYDQDFLTDGSPTGNRPGGWFKQYPFSPADTANGNFVIAASSWFVPVGVASNWLITPNVRLGAHDTLFWKSAPIQTPVYLDGYEVKLSTSTNEDLAFTHLLFTASEMTTPRATIDGLPIPDTTYADYTFSTGDFIHGLDGTYIDASKPYNATNNPHPNHPGRLHPFSIPLDAYANQNIFIGFHHNSNDDNLISIDDVIIRGDTSAASGINENKLDLGLNVFPNPSSDVAQLNYNLSKTSTVTINIFDVTGKLIVSETKGSQVQGRHFTTINTASMAKGFYSVKVQTDYGFSITKLIIK